MNSKQNRNEGLNGPAFKLLKYYSEYSNLINWPNVKRALNTECSVRIG